MFGGCQVSFLSFATRILILLASRDDLDVSSVSVKFNKRQQRATASVRIVSDDIVEETESFHLKMVLPSKEVRKKLLKYGNHRRATVYIKDSEYPFNRMSFCQVTRNTNSGWCSHGQTWAGMCLSNYQNLYLIEQSIRMYYFIVNKPSYTTEY